MTHLSLYISGITHVAAALIGVAMLTAACDRRQLDEPQTPVAIGFSASFENVDDFASNTTHEGTKAAGEIGTIDRIYSGGFGVFGCYTGLNRYSESNVSSDFMHNQQVTWNGSSAWEYEPVKYWPNPEATDGDTAPHFVSFFAYAPYSDGDASAPSNNPAGYCIPSFCNPREVSDPWILYRIHPDPDRQVDLLYSVPLLDQTKPETSAKLQFEFRHALACAGDKVTVQVSDALKAEIAATVGTHYDKAELVLSHISITYTLTEKARLVLWNRGEAYWQAVASEGGSAVRTREVFADERVLYSFDGSDTVEATYTGTGAGIFYIPIEGGVSQKAVVHARYVIRTTQGGSVVDTPHEGDMTLYLRDWDGEGKKLDINITFNNNN